MNKCLIQNFRKWLVASVCRRSPPGPGRMHQRLWQGLRQAIENVFHVDRALPRSKTRIKYIRYGGQTLDGTIKLANINGPLIMMRSAFMSMHRNDIITNHESITKFKMQNQNNVNVNKNTDNNKPKDIIDGDMRYSQCKMPTIVCRQRGALNDRAAYLRRLTSNGFRNFTS